MDGLYFCKMPRGLGALAIFTVSKLFQIVEIAKI
jgi:hypothetical protein